jgi:hypothetical protein
MELKDGDILFCSSRLTWKSFIIKIMRFVIRLFTFSRYEHCAVYLNNYIYEASAKNKVRKMTVKDWMSTRHDFLRFDIFRKELDGNKKDRLIYLFESSLGQEYGFFIALLSAFDFLIPHRLKLKINQKGRFCSEIVAYNLIKIGQIKDVFLPQFTTPEELSHILKEEGYNIQNNIKVNQIWI